MLKLTKDLRSAGSRVWYWKADSIQRESVQQMRQEVFHLDHTWNDIFEEAASQSQTIIIIDGLDSIRDARVSGVFQSLIGLARSKKLTVIASIRVFDLSYSPELRKLFPLEGDPIPETFTNSRFVEMKHIFIPELGDEELNQVQSQFGAVLQILKLFPSLREILRTLFYLELLCELLGQGTPLTDFSIIRTKGELFELWWQKRIDNHLNQHNLLQDLSSVVESMVAERQLSVRYAHWREGVQDDLLSIGILKESSVPGRRLPDANRIEFRHHFLFDHAAMKLFIRPRRTDLATDLIKPVNWGLFLRP